MLEPKALKSFTFGVPRKGKKGQPPGQRGSPPSLDDGRQARRDAARHQMRPAETYKKAIAHKRSRSYHEAISLVLKNRTLSGEDCGPLLEQCFSKLSDHYAALCCAPTSSAADLRKSYRRLCLRYHPDKSNGTTTTLFQVLVRAWEVLSDAEKRRKYDLTRKPTTGLGPKPPPKRTKRKAPCPPSVTKKTAKRPAAKTMRRPTMLRRPTGPEGHSRAPHSLTVVWAQVGGAAGYEVMFRRAGRPWPEKGARVTCAAARKKIWRQHKPTKRASAPWTRPANQRRRSRVAAPRRRWRRLQQNRRRPRAAARRRRGAAAAARKAAAPPPPPSTEAWTCRVCARGNGEDAARCRVCAAPRAYENDRLFGSAAYEKCRAEKRAAQFARPPPAPAPPAPRPAPAAPRPAPPAPRPAPPPVPGAAPRTATPRRSPVNKPPRSPYAQPARPAAARRRPAARAGVGRVVRPAAPRPPPPPPKPDLSATQKFLAAHETTPGWYEVAAAGADARTYYAPATGASSQAPPPNAPQWYRMTDAGHPYFWHAPTGATTWNEPGGSVWRECAAPELGGRQVFVWDGVAVQGGASDYREVQT